MENLLKQRNLWQMIIFLKQIQSLLKYENLEDIHVQNQNIYSNLVSFSRVQQTDLQQYENDQNLRLEIEIQKHLGLLQNQHLPQELI